MEQTLTGAAPVTPSSGPSSWVCTFSLGEALYGVDASMVLEVAPPGPVIEVPGAPPAVVGVSNRRGSPVPLVDLEELLGLPAVGRSQPVSMLVLHKGEVKIAIGIDRVDAVSAFELSATTRRSPNDHAAVAFFLPRGSQVITVLDAAFIFARIDSIRMSDPR